MLRILVFDEHSVYRAGLRSLICVQIPRAEVLEASSPIHALSLIRDGALDLVLVGVDAVSRAALDPFKAARDASPATRFAIMSASDTRADILAGLAAGFHGFISKHQSEAEILAAIDDILSGRIYVPWSLAQAGDAPGSRPGGEAAPTLPFEADRLKLTARQREVLCLLAHGKSNKEIARALDIAEATTKIHLAALLRALGVRNRTEAAFKAGKLVNAADLPSTLNATTSRSTDRSASPAPAEARRA